MKPDRLETFRATYGAAGDWAALFAASADYRGTQLLADAGDPARFMTIDYFATASARAEFLKSHRAAYDALDVKCSEMTIEEAFIGEFDLAG